MSLQKMLEGVTARVGDETVILEKRLPGAEPDEEPVVFFSVPLAKESPQK